ncbi:MAG: septum site-determining protein MinC [Bdellovibrionota bacterium]
MEENLEEKGINTCVTARGTAEGLILRLDGRSKEDDLKLAMKDFIDARKSFIVGSDVTIEWVGAIPEDKYVSNISTILADEYKINVKESRLKDNIVKEYSSKEKSGQNSTKRNLKNKDSKDDDNTGLSLFEGLRLIDNDADANSNLSNTNSSNITSNIKRQHSFQTSNLISNANANNINNDVWDAANTRVVCTTLRSGQKIETEHTLLVLGDVNYGAEIIAAGDVIVLGTLRGIAHAGAYDETGGGRVIFALDLRPTQLRIGSIISRDGNESNKKLPEIAHVDGDLIVVEPYNSRSWKRRG